MAPEETKTKKAILIDCYDNYSNRLQYVEKALRESGYETLIYQSDFDHRTKAHIVNQKPGVKYIAVSPYKKNISAARSVSHQEFAKKCEILIKQHTPDLVYCIIPPNMLVKHLGKYHRKNPRFRLVFDVFDMWPETFPDTLFKFLISPIMRSWQNKRTKFLKYGDLVITRCDLFKELLQDEVPADKLFRVYVCAGRKVTSPAVKDGPLSFAYTGNVTSQTDIDGIVSFLDSIKKLTDVKLYVMGEGEKLPLLKKKITQNHIDAQFSGYVDDEEKKAEIYARCHFGLNMLEDYAYSGMTMKSLEYFSYGLPVINNCDGDIYDMIDEYYVGYNLPREDDGEGTAMLSDIASLKDYEHIQANVLLLHRLFFSEKSCVASFKRIIDLLERQDEAASSNAG